MAASSEHTNSKTKQFRWPTDIVDILFTLHKYKSIIEFKSIDFDGDRPKQYAWVREEMVKSYHDEGNTATEMFGPVGISDPVKPAIEMYKEAREKYTKVIQKENESIKKAMG